MSRKLVTRAQLGAAPSRKAHESREPSASGSSAWALRATVRPGAICDEVDEVSLRHALFGPGGGASGARVLVIGAFSVRPTPPYREGAKHPFGDMVDGLAIVRRSIHGQEKDMSAGSQEWLWDAARFFDLELSTRFLHP